MNYSFYTSKELRPRGWMKRQLEIQAEGLMGNLDLVWRDVRDSAWIGGNAEGWERVPYWLDGFIPLAFLLDNDNMKMRAKKYIDAVIAAQKPDGWLCPCPDNEREKYDTWALMLLSKVLIVWYDCTGDERVPDVLYRAMKNYLFLLSSETIHLFDWGKFRWFECFHALNFLYKKFGEEWIRELGIILKKQGTDYTQFRESWKRPLAQWTLETHAVNLAMMLKGEAISHQLLGEEMTGIADELADILYRYNGTPAGIFTGDECLSGLSPIQGTELCAVVELMYSCEVIYAATGDAKWAEILEKAAFNALPATFSDDMWAHQYDQMANQVAATDFREKSPFLTNGPESNVFGLEPNFGCCTANGGQGFSKLALAAFMHTENLVENVIPVPSELHDHGINIILDTAYPFENRLEYSVSAERDFCLKIRLPEGAKNVAINGKSSEPEIHFTAGKKERYVVTFNTDTTYVTLKNGLSCVMSGSLLFAVPISYKKVIHEYTRDEVERKYPYCDYEYLPKSDWSYAYTGTQLTRCFRGISDIPFSSVHPPCTVSAEVGKIEWGFEDGYTDICAAYPKSTVIRDETKKILLYPYGCAKLRMTELPMCRRKNSEIFPSQREETSVIAAGTIEPEH